ncbi:hypothetical protein, conserved [Babesia bigemina]|uniref:Guanine nucleotide-binding protein-like 3 N-terminal domain-containing protein n=1 Tax=Babesia bigemina TaxID=5866 RepID=A0A061D291_BABBI|nr:hypothetical protein, conserved [Babesia bigemina]CDR94222.1 hypothetical protein, conserved [Babesia bigemina]|eukprot:XP_012766408.1 hypothetical protein, conserved [Babesia bigemina]
MVKLKKGSKRQELSRKYNIQRMVAAHKKKMRRIAKKGEKTTPRIKPPQIPNCIFKREVLENIKRTKQINDKHAHKSKDKQTAI